MLANTEPARYVCAKPGVWCGVTTLICSANPNVTASLLFKNAFTATQTACNRNSLLRNSLFGTLLDINKPETSQNVKVVYISLIVTRRNTRLIKRTRKPCEELGRDSHRGIAVNAFSCGLSSRHTLEIQSHALKHHPCFPPRMNYSFIQSGKSDGPQSVTLASYNTLALVGSGSKHRTRSPL